MVYKKFVKAYPRIAKGIHYAGNALKVAHQAYSMAKVVASIVNSEKKYIDNTIGWNTDTTPQVDCISTVATGDTNITRNGNSIALKSIELKGQIYFDGNNGSESVRVILVRDNDNDSGTAPTFTDVFESAGIMTLRNKLTPSKYTILYDKTFNCDTSKRNVNIMYYKKINMKKDKKGNPTVSVKALFDGSTAADYTKGHIFLMQIGNVATASTVASTAIKTRIRFYDN